MMNKLMAFFTIECFKEINNKKIQNSTEELAENTRVFNVVNEGISHDNNRILNNCHVSLTEQVLDANMAAMEDVLECQQRISNSSDPVEKIDLEKDKIDISFHRTRYVSRAIASYLGYTSTDQDRKYQALKFLFNRNQLLSDEHKKNVENKNALQSKGEPIRQSLVEDFANPNTEMPSYMDPED